MGDTFESDIRSGHARGRWPSFATAMAERDVTSIFAFPLMVGPLRFGAVDLYSRHPLRLDPQQTRRAGALASAVSRHVLRPAFAAGRTMMGVADDVLEGRLRFTQDTGTIEVAP